jgi:16S rRNA (uracil1498-N3)-methyltransferase
VSSFFVDPRAVQGDRLVLGGEEAHHVRVRRYTAGDSIDVIDGVGTFFEARIESLGKEEAICTIVNRYADRGESPHDLWLAVSFLKGQGRFDSLVEKATEVGVAALSPMVTERTVALPGSARKPDRWRRLALAAAKQCGRSRVPRLDEAAGFTEVLERYSAECSKVLLASPAHGPTGVPEGAIGSDLGELSDGCRLGLLVGAEGGFSADEEQAAIDAGAEPYCWGKRALRTDTAAVVLSALILHDAGERVGREKGVRSHPSDTRAVQRT